MSRVFAIGDVHGCLDALDALLAAADTDATDTVVFLGDLVDRGPDSRGVIERAIELGERLRVVLIRGNHEAMMLDARDRVPGRVDWLRVGGRETLDSYGGGFADVPARHWALLESMIDTFETDTHVFCHAGIDPTRRLDRQLDEVLRWRKVHAPPAPHPSGKVVVMGHTHQASGEPADWGHAAIIDTWAYGGGWLSGLDAGTGRVLQASQRAGQVRERWIGRPRPVV